MAKLFFSYSHKDESLRNELETHLAMLKREGNIESWHDRRILVGDDFANIIDEEINRADIILLLVSPYFLDSNYCYEIEMMRALERNAEGTARIIPIILEHCDWLSSPLGELMATPKDGIPISKYPNQHEAFLEVVNSIRDALKVMPIASASHAGKRFENTGVLTGQIEESPRSSNLRIKKEFTQQQKDEFLESTFEYIAKFFEGSLNELSTRNPEISAKFKRIDAIHFTAVVYKDGNSSTQCKILLGGSGSLSDGIAYSSDIHASDNSMNDALSVDTDGHTLFLKPFGMAFRGGDQDERLTQEGGAEYFWETFIQYLQQ